MSNSLDNNIIDGAPMSVEDAEQLVLEAEHAAIAAKLEAIKAAKALKAA